MRSNFCGIRCRFAFRKKEDRLSSLPNDLIYIILSFIDIKDAITTSVLSSRWRLIWRSMPYLNFSDKTFPTLSKFSHFVFGVMFCGFRVSFVEFKVSKSVSKSFFESILNTPYFRNVQQLTASVELIELPISSLEYLTALTTLHLYSVSLVISDDDDDDKRSAGLFCKCTRLKILTLSYCKITGGSNHFTICHPQLSNLTLIRVCLRDRVVNLDVPRLKNLTIRRCHCACYLFSAPYLASFQFEGCYVQMVSADGFLSLEKLHLRIDDPYPTGAPNLIDLLQKFHNVRYLTLHSGTIEILSCDVRPLSYPPSPFWNLETLVVYPERIYDGIAEDVTRYEEVERFFLDSSPNATLEIVSHAAFTT